MITACSQQAISGTETKPASTAVSAMAVAAAAAKPVEQPAWMKTLIGGFENDPVANPPREIIRFKFDGKTVYYVPPICCDIPSQLFSDEGKLMCYPDGGFTGRGDERCPTFHMLKTEEQRVWKDGRERARIKTPL